MKRTYLFSAFCGLLLIKTTHAEFNVHRYFAPIWTVEPRAERKGMLTTEVWSLHGTTTTGKNSEGKTTNLLNILGPQKMHQVGRCDIANNVIVDTNNNVLNQLWNTVPVVDNYAQLEFNGRCSYSGGAFNVAVNFTEKAFIGINVPFYKLAITNITWKDITPEFAQDAAWIQFKNHFDEILTLNNLSIGPSLAKQVGDMLVYAGWTINNEAHDQLDFVDFTVRMGVLLGNDQKRNIDQVFSFPGGYNGHKGILADLNLGIGMNNRIGIDLHAKGIVLFNKNQETRMQTATGQSSFIKLAKGIANYNPGNIYSVGGAFRIDTFDQVGLVFSYLYNHSQTDKLTPKNSVLFPPQIINLDPQLSGWSMHTIGASLDLNFTNYERKFHPRASFHYNYIIKGTRIFLNNTLGGRLGLTITADF